MFTPILTPFSQDEEALGVIIYQYPLTGHQQLINQVVFSPDARLIASASFDKSIKLWDGKTGKYVQIVVGPE